MVSVLGLAGSAGAGALLAEDAGASAVVVVLAMPAPVPSISSRPQKATGKATSDTARILAI